MQTRVVLSYTWFKGTVLRVFLLRFFFSEIIFPQAPENNTKIILNFSKVRRDIHKSRCTIGITVSTTPVANFAIGTTSVVDTSVEFASSVNDAGRKIWEQYLTTDTVC